MKLVIHNLINYSSLIYYLKIGDKGELKDYYKHIKVQILSSITINLITAINKK